MLRIFAEPQPGAHTDFELTHTWGVTTEQLLEHVEAGARKDLLEWFRSKESHTLSVTYRPKTANAAVGAGDLQAARIHLVELNGLAVGEVGTQPGWKSGPAKDTATGHEIPLRLAQTLAANVAFIGPRTIPAGTRQLTPERHLHTDAANLANVLFALHSDPGPVFDEIQAIMRGAFPSIDRIMVRLDEGSSPTTGQPVVYYKHAPEEPILLSDTGSGVGQMLALVTGVLTNRTGRLFLIDEPQAFLHPQVEHDLLSLLEAHPEHQYVIATHSNVILNSRPLAQARLLRTEGGVTKVVSATHDELLSELGITAADLWLAARILWGEGPTEVGVFQLLLEELPPAQRAAVRIRQMPVASSMFIGKGSRAELNFRFLEEVIDATRELPVLMTFVFDLDEKTGEEVARLVAASRASAVVLPRRELENFFLDADLIYTALTTLCEQTDQEPPELTAVATRLRKLLEATDDDRLFPQGPPPEGADAIVVVKGSRVLKELWREFATAEYDKSKYGEALARLALETSPELLEPLRAILRTLVETPAAAA